MPDDEAADIISNVDFQRGPAAAVGAIPIIPHQDVEDAARAVIDAAVAARKAEFIEIPGVVAVPNMVFDLATGDVYVFIVDGWLSSNGNKISVYPTETVAAGDYAWILDAFKYFHERWPAFPHAMAEGCERAKRAIQGSPMGRISSVARALDNWGGLAHESFMNNFLAPFSQAVLNQQGLLDELAIAMQAYEAVLRKGRLDAHSISENTVAVLDAIAAGDDVEIGLTFGVIGAVAGIVAAIASGGTTLALTAGLISAAASGIEVVADHLADSPTIAGHTVDDVLRSMTAALDALRVAMDAEEDLIAGYLERQADEIRGWLSSDDSLTTANILPNEPNDDNIDNLTSGELPGRDDFRTRH